MFKLENNPEKDKKILDFFSEWEEKIKKNKARIVVVFLGLLFFAFFGENIFGDWFSKFGDFLKTVLLALGYLSFNYFQIEKKKKNKEKDVLKENNLEKILDDSMGKNITDSVMEYESNKNDILINSIGDINNSKEEWKIKFYLLVFLGVLLWVNFTFMK